MCTVFVLANVLIKNQNFYQIHRAGTETYTFSLPLIFCYVCNAKLCGPGNTVQSNKD